MTVHLVYGNGESRPRELLSGNYISWGCNAIYRDLTVDNLVVIDYPMQQEVYESNYPMKNKCWFADWEVLPTEFAPDAIIEGWDDPIYETPKKGRSSCVVQGKTKETVEANLREMLQHNPDIDVEDFKRKAGKDVGLYVTWVEEYNDKVINIDYPKGWSAGNTALYLACKYGATEIYMLGFDGSDYKKPINNVYKGSDNYLPANSRGFNTISWDNQFKMVQRDFPNVKFYKVGTDFETFKATLTYEELKKHTLT
tara:strand:+ start:256 stop:1017 length:762 start_codon:yes stop_codon:yes gene_type:complete